jgi:hypothetical protein
LTVQLNNFFIPCSLFATRSLNNNSHRLSPLLFQLLAITGLMQVTTTLALKLELRECFHLKITFLRTNIRLRCVLLTRARASRAPLLKRVS